MMEPMKLGSRPTAMHVRPVVAAALLGLTLAGCGGGDDDVVVDPGSSSTAPTRPDGVPAAPGEVVTRHLVTVIDTGKPELCLGPIAESFPPQCSGPVIVGWDWDDLGKRPGAFTSSGDVRFGTFQVSGTWDGTALTLTRAVPGASFDPAPETATPILRQPSVQHTDAELADIAEQVTRELPGVQSASPDQAGHVLAEVTYDDGSLQAYADDTWGAGVVVVTGLLVDTADR